MNRDWYEEFIEHFGMLEDYTKRLVNQHREGNFIDRVETFIDRVETLRGKKKISEKAAEIFGQASRIRNINSHGIRPRGHIIVNPTKAFVLEFISACDEVLDNIPLNAYFLKVDVFGTGDRTDNVLRYMNDHDYSQVVVEDSTKKIRLVTSQDFMQWIIKNINKGDLILDTSKPIGSILDDCGKSEWTCRKKSGYLREVHTAFRMASKKGKKLQAVLLTDSGKPERPVRGIITPWDIKGVYG
jgi:hypothetical protein